MAYMSNTSAIAVCKDVYYHLAKMIHDCVLSVPIKHITGADGNISVSIYRLDYIIIIPHSLINKYFMMILRFPVCFL